MQSPVAGDCPEIVQAKLLILHFAFKIDIYVTSQLKFFKYIHTSAYQCIERYAPYVTKKKS